jgi:hypothetical protein
MYSMKLKVLRIEMHLEGVKEYHLPYYCGKVCDDLLRPEQ